MNTYFAPKTIRRIILSVTVVAGLSLASTSLTAQTSSVRSQIAELNQRFSQLERNYKQLELEVYNLRAKNDRLKQELEQMKKTSSNEDMEEVVNAKIAAHRKSTNDYIKQQLQRIMEVIPSEPRNTNPPPAVNPFTQPNQPSVTPTSPAIVNYPRNGKPYVVKSGDTLSKIAKKFGSKVSYITAANQLKNPNSVQVGQKLFIPIDK